MAVGINIERGGAEIAWETGDYVGPVTIKAINTEDFDVGIVKDTNDGKHFLTWPVGTWTDEIIVYATGDLNDLTEDNVLDNGVVTVVVGGGGGGD